MRKKMCAVFCGLAWIAASPALGWTPSECGEEIAQYRQEHAQKVRRADEGSMLYAPRPFPKRTSEVLEDLRYAYLKIMADNDFSKLPPEAELVYDGLQSGELKLTVIRVEDWSLTRCQRHRPNAFDYLVRIYLEDGKTEVARAIVKEDGLLGAWHYRPADEETRGRWLEVLRSPEQARAEVAAKLGVHASEGQLVHLSGTLSCPLLEPCVALRGEKGKGAYVVNREGEVFRVGEERFSRIQATHPATRSTAAEGRWEGPERLVSIGDDFAVARRVGQIAPTSPPS
jgi:hypothetical protein